MSAAAPVPAEGAVVEDRIAVASNWKLVWWRFRRHRLALVSAVVLAMMYMVVLAPDFFSTQNPEATDARQAFIPVQGIRLFNDGKLSPWVPAIVGKRHPVTLRMEWSVDPNKRVPVIILTREVREATMNDAIAHIEKLKAIAEKVTRIRVYRLED